MTFYRKIGLAVVCIAAVSLLGASAWITAYPSCTYRYRLTFDVEVGDAVKTGTGVVQVYYQSQPQIGQNGTGVEAVKGEAVVIDLGERGLLLALLVGDRNRGDAEEITNFAFADELIRQTGSNGDKAARKVLSTLDAKTTLTPETMPMMVHFSNINDPATVVKVDPYNLAASFGPGVRLKAAEIAMTHDDVTTGIVKLLPWLLDRAILTPPGWAQFPRFTQIAITGLRRLTGEDDK